VFYVNGLFNFNLNAFTVKVMNGYSETTCHAACNDLVPILVEISFFNTQQPLWNVAWRPQQEKYEILHKTVGVHLKFGTVKPAVEAQITGIETATPALSLGRKKAQCKYLPDKAMQWFW